MEVQRLLEDGLLAEDGLAESEGGRRSSLLGIPPKAGLIAAVDVGATSIDVALTTLGSEIVAHRGESADIKDGPRTILGRVKALLEDLLGEQSAEPRDVLSVGIGVPGPVEQAAGVLRSPHIMPGWDRFQIRSVFAGDYAAPVFVDNDVNVMALGEHWGGVGKGLDNMLFIKIGTGIGGGVIADGRLYRGTQGCAGDIGHRCVDSDGPVCSWGNRGCLEAMEAAPAIALKAERCAREGLSKPLRATRRAGRAQRQRRRRGSVARGLSCARDHQGVRAARGASARYPGKHAQPFADRDRGRRGHHRPLAVG